MFILRWVTTVFAIIGVVLGATLIYVGFFPLTIEPKPKISLFNTVGCQSKSTTYKSSDIQSKDVNDLKTLLGTSAPIELVRDFSTSVDSIVNSIGSSTRINIEYCDVTESNDTLLNKFNGALDKEKKYYDSGAINDFIVKFNELPTSNISNIEIKVPARFARSNYCNTPIQKTSMYLFTIIESGISKKAVIFNIELENSDGNKPEYKFVRNIVTSAQYVKAQLYCNG